MQEDEKIKSYKRKQLGCKILIHESQEKKQIIIIPIIVRKIKTNALKIPTLSLLRRRKGIDVVATKKNRKKCYCSISYNKKWYCCNITHDEVKKKKCYASTKLVSILVGRLFNKAFEICPTRSKQIPKFFSIFFLNLDDGILGQKTHKDAK